MSKRKMQFGHKEVTGIDLTRVMWGVLQKLEDQGLDIGDEARALLKRKFTNKITNKKCVTDATRQ